MCGSCSGGCALCNWLHAHHHTAHDRALLTHSHAHTIRYRLHIHHCASSSSTSAGDSATGAQTADSIEEPLHQVVPMSNLMLARQLCTMLDAILPSGDAENEDFDTLEGAFCSHVVRDR